MNTLNIFTCQRCLTVIGAMLLASSALAGSSQQAALADAQARFHQDMAFCDSPEAYQPRETCRLEARNALAEAKRGGLSDAPDQYTRNALLRCEQFQGDDRKACDARVLKPSRVEGSVSGGGQLRESVITVPAQ